MSAAESKKVGGTTPPIPAPDSQARGARLADADPPDAPSSVDEFVRVEAENQNHFYLGKGEGKGWRRMLKVDPSLRSWLSGAMIYVETTLDFLDDLSPGEITPELQRKLPLVSQMFEKIVQDLKSPYLDNGSLSLLALERIQNLLFRDKRASMLRLNINMTDANKVDKSGNLGTAYKNAVLEWLQKEFGERHISLNPEGTSYLAINVSRHEISCSLGRFAREILDILDTPEMYERYKFDPTLLEGTPRRFTPSATGMFMTVGTEDLKIEEILGSQDAEATRALQKRMIGLIEEAMRLLAVGSTLAEKDPASIGLASGLSVYDAVDLPLVPGTVGYEILQNRLELGTGYVPPSVYISRYIRGTPTMDEKFKIHPRYGHDYGLLDHPWREDTPGGYLQLLQKAILALSIAETMEEKQHALTALQSAVKKFSLILDIGRIARSNSRNPAFTKWRQEIKLSNKMRLEDTYFIERVPLRTEEKVHIVTMEIDDFKAFSDTYPVDEKDSNFWGVFKPFFEEAKDRGIDQPLITQIAGDLVILAVPIVDSSEDAVDIDAYVKAAQERVKKKYENMPFQPRSKVNVRNGIGFKTERLPLWKKGNAVMSAAKQPKDTTPFITTLTVTAIAATAPTPHTSQDKRIWEHNIAEIASRIETLKEEAGPHKGGYTFHAFDEAKDQMDGRTSFTGIYRVGAGDKRDLITERFEASMDRQLSESWGDGWKNMDEAVRVEFMDGLKKRAADSPAILMPDDFIDVAAQIGGAELVQFPPAPILFMPLMAGAFVA